MQFKTLIDITAIDFLNNHNRFEVVYSLLSVRYNLRIFLKIYLNEFFLTNYGFNGYPLRKDFAVIGYLGVRYDDCDKYILSESIEMSQSNLEFIHNKTPWK